MTPVDNAAALTRATLSRASSMATDDPRARFGLPNLWQSPWLLTGLTALAAVALHEAGRRWPQIFASQVALPQINALDGVPAPFAPMSPAIELFKLVVAALIGLVITGVQRRTREGQTSTRPMEQAQVLLAVAGALMMIIIGNSLARAFGIAGAASIVRFRTPVDDPRDVTVLFLLMGLGMAAGLGALSVAAVGAAFLAGCLILLSRLGEAPERSMQLVVVADSETIPTDRIHAFFASRRIAIEPVELTTGENAIMRYRACLAHDVSLEDITAQLLDGRVVGIKSVSWERKKADR